MCLVSHLKKIRPFSVNQIINKLKSLRTSTSQKEAEEIEDCVLSCVPGLMRPMKQKKKVDRIASASQTLMLLFSVIFLGVEAPKKVGIFCTWTKSTIQMIEHDYMYSVKGNSNWKRNKSGLMFPVDLWHHWPALHFKPAGGARILTCVWRMAENLIPK